MSEMTGESSGRVIHTLMELQNLASNLFFWGLSHFAKVSMRITGMCLSHHSLENMTQGIFLDVRCALHDRFLLYEDLRNGI